MQWLPVTVTAMSQLKMDNLPSTCSLTGRGYKAPGPVLRWKDTLEALAEPRVDLQLGEESDAPSRKGPLKKSWKTKGSRAGHAGAPSLPRTLLWRAGLSLDGGDVHATSCYCTRHCRVLRSLMFLIPPHMLFCCLKVTKIGRRHGSLG